MGEKKTDRMGNHAVFLLGYNTCMTLHELKHQFLEYLEIEKGRSVHTVTNYDHYLTRFLEYAKVTDPAKLSEDDGARISPLA